MTLHNINIIARYEVKLLKRSWLFRIFALLALLGITLITLGYQSSVFGLDTVWPRLAVSSLMPFCNIFFYNIAQSVIVIFLAGSFLKRDKKLDTAEVIYVRPMSNADYIIGKTWGIVKVFLGLNLLSLFITAFFNIVINHSPFSWFPYVFYLFTISLPSLLFVLGLSFTVMCLLKNQAVTFILMLGLTGTIFFYLSDTLSGVFDFFGTCIPTIFSDVTGHSNLGLFLLQRTIYLLSGAGFIGFTIALVKRLPHKPWKNSIIYAISCLLVLAGIAAGLLYVLDYNHQIRLRNEYAATFNKYSRANPVSVINHDLTIVPTGKQLQGESILKVKNRHSQSIEEIILYLNPSLKVKGLKAGNEELTFTRENQVILIHKQLDAGEEFTFTLHEQGSIDENICYTDVSEKDYTDNTVPQAFYRLGKRYAWLEQDFTLLTPECIWYPVTIAPVHPAEPYNIQKNFVHYTLTVIPPKEKTVLSQGESTSNGDTIIFTNRHPLPGISLTIADYDKKSLQIDSTLYEIYYFKGHDYFSSHFSALHDTLPGVIRDLKNDAEFLNGRDYPFSKFVLAETPVHFATYVRNWKGYTEYVMPEIVFIPERGATLNSDFNAEKKRVARRGRHNQMPLSEEETAIQVFNRFMENFFNENIQYGWDWQNQYINKLNITPLFYSHTGFILSEQYPILDIVLNTVQNVANTSNVFHFWEGIINNKQRANLYLENHSFRDAISSPELKPEIFYELLKLKSIALRNYIQTQIPRDDFNRFLKDFFERNHFSDIPFETFEAEFEAKFGISLSDFIPQWYTEDHSPTILIREVDANQVVIDDETKYQIRFKVYNPSDVDAIITAEIRQGGGFQGGIEPDKTENYQIPAQQAREIKIIADNRPASITINTNISHNLPTTHIFNFSKIENIISDTLAGSFVISPALFAPNPHEIIIDNEDSGFQTIASNKRHKLKDLFQKQEQEKYKNFMPWWTPTKWTAIAADYCYGETVQSAVYKSKGSGLNSVEWRTELPGEGYYDVSVWNPKTGGSFGMNFGRRNRRDREERNQTYVVAYDQEKESITLDIEQEDSGWVSLGSFYFPKGEVKITLTDDVSGSYVIADAVKFTRINE